MGATEKCAECRNAKRGCYPKDRVWNPDSSEQERCTPCVRGNKTCGPNIPPERQPCQSPSQGRENSYSSSITLAEDFRMGSEYPRPCSDSGHVTGVYMIDNSRELRARLEDLDADAELANRVHLEIESMENRGVHGSKALIRTPEYYKMLEFKHATCQSLLTRLDEVGTLAARAHSAGEMDLAENAYTRMLDIYKRQPSPSVSLIHSLLTKMALFYWKSNQPIRAERCWREILELQDSTGKHRYIGTEVWESLALVSSRTSSLLSRACQAHHPELYLPLNLQTPFPPFQALITCEYPSEIRHKGFQNEHCSNNIDPSTIHNDTTGSARSLSEFINRMSDDSIDNYLRTRDILSRTPLFLAAIHKQEDVGNALIARIKSLSECHQEMHMNTRDLSNQTVLGIATLSGCSLKFIKTLIKGRALIDPDILCPQAATPLQAACTIQRPDIVKLFLDYDASIDRVYPGNLTALEIARVLQNDTIIQLINSRISLQLYVTRRDNMFQEIV